MRTRRTVPATPPTIAPTLFSSVVKKIMCHGSALEVSYIVWHPTILMADGLLGL